MSRNFHTRFTRMVSTAMVILGSVGSAYSADLPPLTTKVPEIPPLSAYGFTLYGVVDISAQYESRYVPMNGPVPTSGGIISPSARNGSGILIVPNQESQSFVGLKYERPIWDGVTLLAKAEIGFNPTSGELSDGLSSLRINNGVPLAQQTSGGDGTRAGQLFNGELWIGASSTSFGNLYVGRINTLSLDAIGKYDPMPSYGFSLLAFIGSLAGGGSTEDLRVDQSIKYTYANGPWHAAGFYGTPDTNAKDVLQGNAGADFRGFSFDFLASHVRDGVSAFSLAAPNLLGSPFVGAKVFDSTTYGAFSKYTLYLGSQNPDRSDGFRSNVTFSGGVARVDYANPSDGGLAVGHTDIGGYLLGPAISTTGSGATGIVNYGFTGGDRLLYASFLGVKYQSDPKLTLSAAYYRFDQKSYGLGVTKLPFYNGTGYSGASCDSSSFTNCSGKEQVASLRADYLLSRNINLYAGLAWSRVDGGLAFSYLNKEMYNTTLGAKFLF